MTLFRLLLLLVWATSVAACSAGKVNENEQAKLVTGYATEAMHLVQSEAHLPLQAAQANESGSVLLQVDLGRDGSLKEVTIALSSGRSDLDTEAVSALRRLPRLPPVPGGMMPSAGSITLEIPVNFISPTLQAAQPNPATALFNSGMPPNPLEIYLQALSARIGQSVRYPPSSVRVGEEGDIMVRVVMLRDGTITNTLLLHPSGHALLDAEALMAFVRIGTLPPVPANIFPQATKFVFTMPVRFRLR